MLIGETLPFVNAYIEELDRTLRTLDPGAGLSSIRKGWLGFCVLAVIVTNSVCWKRFERASLGRWHHPRLSWLFRQPQRFWQSVLHASVVVLLERYRITEVMVVLDDSDKLRCKTTTRIYKAHKLKDKTSGGTVNGQSVVLLLVVTPLVTIPAGMEFYGPDPAMTAWHKLTKALKKQGVPPKERPPKPSPNPLYPTKQAIGLRLLRDFCTHCPHLRIRGVLADTLYGTSDFLDTASA